MTRNPYETTKTGDRHPHEIVAVLPDSIGEEMGIEPGDLLLAVNGQPMADIFDYQYQMENTYVEVLVEKPNGEQWELQIPKEEDEDLGIAFASSLMDDYRSCTNKCIFCFIDQMPPGMRETLYFKDDDSRLSFLQGNYVTLTNMKDEELDRIIRYHMAPINISFHTTNPALRCRMLHNRFAGDIMEKMQKLYDAGIEMNGQIVLCRGINDGEELERTIHDVSRFLPFLKSVSVVPVGLTKYRDGLPRLELFTKEDAAEVLRTIHKWQGILYEHYGLHFVHASDEWYIMAGEPLPEEDRYDGYLQIENGVGMVRSLLEEFDSALEEYSGAEPEGAFSSVCGRLVYPFICQMAEKAKKRFPKITWYIYPIENRFFGETITVTGLITGQDLCGQIKGRPLGRFLLLPSNMLRSGEEVFLDDYTVEQVERTLGVPAVITESDGYDVLEKITEHCRNGEQCEKSH